MQFTWTGHNSTRRPPLPEGAKKNEIRSGRGETFFKIFLPPTRCGHNLLHPTLLGATLLGPTLLGPHFFYGIGPSAFGLQTAPRCAGCRPHNSTSRPPERDERTKEARANKERNFGRSGEGQAGLAESRSAGGLPKMLNTPEDLKHTHMRNTPNNFSDNQQRNTPNRCKNTFGPIGHNTTTPILAKFGHENTVGPIRILLAKFSVGQIGKSRGSPVGKGWAGGGFRFKPLSLLLPFLQTSLNFFPC